MNTRTWKVIPITLTGLNRLKDDKLYTAPEAAHVVGCKAKRFQSALYRGILDPDDYEQHGSRLHPMFTGRKLKRYAIDHCKVVDELPRRSQIAIQSEPTEELRAEAELQSWKRRALVAEAGMKMRELMGKQTKQSRPWWAFWRRAA